MSLKSLLGILFISTLAFSQAKLSVERIFDAPSLSGVSVSDVSWSPDAKTVAYLKADGSRNRKDLWLYELASKQSALFISAGEILAGEQKFSKDEAMMRERTRRTDLGITRFLWTPDGKTVIIPLSGDVFSVDVRTKAVRQITKTPQTEFDVKVSPDGKLLGFVREGEIVVLDLASNMERQLTSGATAKIKNGISEYIAQEEMDRHTGYWWSPDSRSIAYLQIDNTPVKEFHLTDFTGDFVDVEKQEYAKAGEANTIVKVGVVGVGDGKTVWLNLGKNSDIYVPRVDWFPDGKHVAVQIQSRNQDTLDLVLFDLARGASRLLLRETNAQWVRLHDDLMFIQNGEKFIWASERDGMKHLYLGSFPAPTKPLPAALLNQITKGKWEVEKLVAVDEASEIIFFTAFEKSPLEKHLYSIKLDGSEMRRLTTSEGSHAPVMSSNYKHYVDTYSNAARPPLVACMTTDNSTAAMIEQNVVGELEQYALPAPEYFTIKSADGKWDLHALVIKPTSFRAAKKYPVIVYQYQGPTSQVVTKSWGGPRMLWHRSMAERGYLVFMVDGRGTPGRGREFQQMLHRNLGKYELEDQLAGAAYVKSLPYVDSTRIMIWGKSYGGYMTCLAMFRSAAFKLGIAAAPVTLWNNYDTHYTERYMERPQENPEGYKESSPLTHAAGLKGKLLLIHGVADDNVHFQDSMVLADALQKAGKQFDFMAYPKATHSFAGKATATHWYNLMTRYILDNL